VNIAVLTSSRADYGIYLPLLKAIHNDSTLKLSVIAFGTHLSPAHGETVNAIINDGFNHIIKVDTMPDGDTPGDISRAMGKTMTAFSSVWDVNPFDLIIALGDRYEMFAACASVMPFNIPIAHIHGGETTEGAIDDAFRHGITQMSKLHFTTTKTYSNRVAELKGNNAHIYNVGALSLDNLKNTTLLSIAEFKDRFNIDMAKPGILITFHPETVALDKNKGYIGALIDALEQLTAYQLIITMPNADTMGNMIREKLNGFISATSNAIGIESFGMLGYLSCMKHCSMMLGNTSSGFVEAAFFPKWVINLGDRQKGRILTPNILQTPVTKESILAAVHKIEALGTPPPVDVYGDGHTAQRIVQLLKQTL
jgi:GDP/UDP-N,N'-diacetylbacillosamine 2-epimerase (hydrolysing)